MSFLKSILFGSEGSHNILGVKVNFIESHSSSIELLQNRALNIITQAPAHILSHEMGHVFTIGAFLPRKAKEVKIVTHLLEGKTIYLNSNTNKIVDSIISFSGPSANMVFSSCKLIGAVALRNYITTPVAITLGTGAVVWMANELLSAYAGASSKNDGDFGIIAKNGATHLAIASAALVGQVALGVFAAAQ